MDLALAVFNIGAGLGLLAAGSALAYLAWQTTPLIRESRALAADLRRLARLADEEARPVLDRAREVSDNVEVLGGDVAVKLDHLAQLLTRLETSLDTGHNAAGPGRPGAWSVESAPQTRADEGDG
jgi:hypothetical protein